MCVIGEVCKGTVHIERPCDVHSLSFVSFLSICRCPDIPLFLFS